MSNKQTNKQTNEQDIYLISHYNWIQRIYLIIAHFNPFLTQDLIYLVTLFIICHIILVMLVQRIWYWINY